MDASCIRKKTNWTKSSPQYKFDDAAFDTKAFTNDQKRRSPKVDALLKKIESLDKEDKKKHGHHFKHFIFCDVKSSQQGARMLASAFLSSGYHLAYRAKGIEGEEKEELLEQTSSGEKKKMRADTPRPPPTESWNLNHNIPKLSAMKKSMPKFIEEEQEIFETIKFSPKSMDGGQGIQEAKSKKESKKGSKKEFGKIELLASTELNKSKGNNFYLLSSVNVYEQPIAVKTKKDILKNFNDRDENVHGEQVRFIIMDSGFKEGIDLFDIKYVHIFEPPVTSADQKQVIGRGTRTCGQQGLQFHPTQGWPLHVFIYDVSIPKELSPHFLETSGAFDLYMRAMNMDMKMVNFGADLEDATIFGAVDYDLNRAVHEFDTVKQMKGGDVKKQRLVIKGPPLVFNDASTNEIMLPSGRTVPGMDPTSLNHHDMRGYIKRHYSHAKWDDVKMENLCESSSKKGGAKVITYTPTQRFIKDYFSPQCLVKGMLLWHSTGTGKTCSAIAAASSSFAAQGYTILWVTRTTLKNDVWKNMFDLVCNEQIRNMMADGLVMPEDQKERMKLLSKAWKIRPISYKQFSNLVSKENSYYEKLVKLNGKADPLRKTLLVIDEAHKLYGGGDLSSIERPDMKALHESIMNSYAISGQQSARVLLMTATPMTENPMEIVQLVNLLKPYEKQLPKEFPLFAHEFLKEDGTFTTKGKKQYLDAITGHISYLNRERDARQFAQPQIEHIRVPITKDVQEIAAMDKKLTRALLNEDIRNVRKQIDEEAGRIDEDFRDLESSRFFVLRDMCDAVDNEIKKGCLKVANANIRELVQEAKTHIKDIKDKMKELRATVKAKAEHKKSVLGDMQERLDAEPEKVREFEESMYYVLKYGCNQPLEKNKSLDTIVQEHPKVIQLKAEIGVFDDKIANLDKSLKILLEKHRIKMNEMRELIKTGELNQLERFVMRDALKLERKKYSNDRKTQRQNVKDGKSELRKTRRNMSKKLTRWTKKMKKNMQTEKKRATREQKEKTRTEKKLRKTLRKQGRLRESFKDGIVKDLVSKYSVKAKQEFLDVKAELEERVREKQALKKEKKEQKQGRLEERERTKKEKQETNEKERQEKREKKEQEKKKKREKKEQEKKERNNL